MITKMGTNVDTRGTKVGCTYDHKNRHKRWYAWHKSWYARAQKLVHMRTKIDTYAHKTWCESQGRSTFYGKKTESQGRSTFCPNHKEDPFSGQNTKNCFLQCGGDTSPHPSPYSDVLGLYPQMRFPNSADTVFLQICTDLHGFLTNFHGFTRICTNSHGFTRIYTDLHKFLQSWCAAKCCGHGFFTDLHGFAQTANSRLLITGC